VSASFKPKCTKIYIYGTLVMSMLKNSLVETTVSSVVDLPTVITKLRQNKVGFMSRKLMSRAAMSRDVYVQARLG
jgi:hypothetical protein